MNAIDHDETPAAPPPVSDPRVLLARITWFFLGPAMLLLLSVRIVESGSGWATIYDAMFFVMLALIVFARWFELRSGQGQDESGQPTTLAAFRPYVSRVVPIGVAVWGVANILGNHLLS